MHIQKTETKIFEASLENVENFWDYTEAETTGNDATANTPDDDTTTAITITTASPESDGDQNKWLVPLLVGLGCLVLVIVIGVVIYRKWKCFGLPLPFIRRRFQLAKPLKKLADSVRSSITSSTWSIGSQQGMDKQYRKYAVKLDGITRGDNHNVMGENDWKNLGQKDYSGEFQALKRADPKDVPMTVALKPENMLRNRFSNILPYDRSRVVLTTTTASGISNDYVNASYVSGYCRDREFICTQGPLKHTVEDFWRLCWESKAVAIVMLTKCYEKNKEKCYPYWPSGNTGCSTFGEIKVTLEGQTAWKLKKTGGDADDIDNKGGGDHLWLVSELSLEKESEEGAVVSHKIIHIVLLSWPDFGVVEPPSSLLCFVKHVQKLVGKSRKSVVEKEENDNVRERCGHIDGPIVVHCSAGVGRSGVYIAVDQLLQQTQENEKKSESDQHRKSVNIFQLVARMRRERMGMVQNLQQYTLIYKCLQVLLRNKVGNDKVSDDQKEPVRISVDEVKSSDWGLIM